MVGFKKILFPTDFSANADKALAHAVRLAEFDSGEVIVQHVVSDYFEKHPHWATLFDLHEIVNELEKARKVKTTSVTAAKETGR